MKHINHVISRVKSDVESLNVTGKTVTVILGAKEAADKLGEFLKLPESAEHPGNYEGANGGNYWFVLGPTQDVTP